MPLKSAADSGYELSITDWKPIHHERFAAQLAAYSAVLGDEFGHNGISITSYDMGGGKIAVTYNARFRDGIYSPVLATLILPGRKLLHFVSTVYGEEADPDRHVARPKDDIMAQLDALLEDVRKPKVKIKTFPGMATSGISEDEKRKLAQKPEPQPGTTQLTHAQLKHMAERFLRWKLPENFKPDGGIHFEAIANKGTQFEYRHVPSGTNLLDYTQALEMLDYVTRELPAT